MTTVRELTDAINAFDKEYGLDWTDVTEDKLLEALQYGAIALTGEAGECANIVKKMLRDRLKTGTYDAAMVEPLKEELIDVFMYLLKLFVLLKIDVDKEFFKKLEFNKKRFAKYKVE